MALMGSIQRSLLVGLAMSSVIILSDNKLQASEEFNNLVVGFGASAGRMRAERFDYFTPAMLWFHGVRKEKALYCLDLD